MGGVSRSFDIRLRMKLHRTLSLVLLALVIASCGDSSHSGSGKEITYAAIGASDATGVGAVPLTNGYVFKIRDELNAKGMSVNLDNFGIPGAKIPLMKEAELPAAILVDPDLVTIFAGANDLVAGAEPADFENSLATILSDLHSKTHAVVAIANLPDLTELPSFQSNPDPDVTTARVIAFNAAIARQASAHGALLVDLSTEQVGADVTAADGFHPNNQGYEIMAQKYLAVIEPALGVQ